MNSSVPSFYAATRGMWTLTWRTRITWRKIMPLLLNMFVFPVLAGSVLRTGQVEGFYRFSIDLYLLLILPITCLNHFGSMIRDELQDDTMTFLITRPVSRARILLIKYITLAIWVQILALGSLTAFLIVGHLLEISEITSIYFKMLQIQILAVFAYGALSCFLGLLTQKFMIAGVFYGILVEFGIGRIPTNINILSISKHLKTMLAQHPELAEFYRWSAEGATSSGWIVLAGTVGFLALSALLFTVREYHHTDEMQKSG